MSTSIDSTMSVKVWAMLLTLSVVWGGSFYFNAVLVNELAPITVVFLRVALAAIFLWIYIGAKRIPVPTSKSAWANLGAMGLLNNVIPFGLIVWAQTIISSSLASILNATVPLMTVVLAAVLLNDERISSRKAAGVVIGFIGTAWILAPDIQRFDLKNILGQLAMLGAALSYSFASIFGRRFSRMQLHPVTTAAGQVSASALLTLPLVLVFDKPEVQQLLNPQILFSILSLALFSTAVAYILYFKILAAAGATNLVLVTFLIPVWASLLGILLLNESLTSNILLGMLIIALGLSLIDGRLWNKLTKS